MSLKPNSKYVRPIAVTRKTLGSRGSTKEWVQIPPHKIVPDYAPDGNAYLFVMYVGGKPNLSAPGYDEVICFVRPMGGL